jgi:hypothetical protein
MSGLQLAGGVSWHALWRRTFAGLMITWSVLAFCSRGGHVG